MNTTLMIGQFVPIVILAILTLTLIEAAGAGTELRWQGHRDSLEAISLHNLMTSCWPHDLILTSGSCRVSTSASRPPPRSCSAPTSSSCRWWANQRASLCHVTSPDQSQVFASFLTGTLASYEQNPAMYGTFTLINGMLGASVFFFHCTGNERVTLTHVHWTRWTKYFRWEPCWWRHTRKLSKRRSSNVDTFDQTKNYVDTEIPKILIYL